MARWPLVKPYIEIEADSAKKISTVIRSLGINGIELGNANIIEIFKRSGRYGMDVKDLICHSKKYKR
jgi:hypothetical protein